MWCGLRLVALQMTDEMPSNSRMCRLHFVERFLNLVFSDVSNATSRRGIHRVGTVSLCHRDQPHRLSVPATQPGSVDPVPHVVHPQGQVRKRHKL